VGVQVLYVDDNLDWDPWPDFCYCQTFLVIMLWGALSLTRGRVWNLLEQFAATLRCKSRRIQDHILLSHLRLIQLGGPVRLGVRHPYGTSHQFFFLIEIFIRQLLVCCFVAPSLTRGPICNLHEALGRVGVLLAADSQSTSSGYRASLWDPWTDFILLFFLRLTITLFFFRRRLLWRENGPVVYSAITH
jgi:hypothetical protein